MPAPDFSDLTAQIIAAVEANPDAPDLPWRRAGLHLPTNAQTGKAYRGINVLTLWAATIHRGYQHPLWATYRQWSALGAQVLRGERGTPIVYFQDRPHDADDNDQRRRPLARSSMVFCADQVSSFAPPLADVTSDWDRFSPAEAFIAGTGADIRYGGGEAYYAPLTDHIQIPCAEDFIDTPTSTARDGYYSTTFHELAHWSGAKKRLDRDLSGKFGSRSYAMEELVAELAAAFACAALNVTSTVRADHARYVANWAKVLRDEPRAISHAAGRAAESLEYLTQLGKPRPSPGASDNHGEEIIDRRRRAKMN